MTDERSDERKYSIAVLGEDVGYGFCWQKNRGYVEESADWLEQRLRRFSTIVQNIMVECPHILREIHNGDLDSLCSMFYFCCH